MTDTIVQKGSGLRRRLMLIGAVLAGALLVVAAFFAGTALGGSAQLPVTSANPTASATPTAEATDVPPAEPVAQGPRAPGTYPWNELGGTECVDPFLSAWQPEFTVVDCAAPHGAQLLVVGDYSSDPAAPYPGEAALTAGLNLACTSAEVLDPATAAALGDVAWQASYPPSETEWNMGERSYYCFAVRTSGQPITGSLIPTP